MSSWVRKARTDPQRGVSRKRLKPTLIREYGIW